MKNDVDYVINDGKIVIVDSFTGRLMQGRQYSDGLHQAIEAKEGVEIQEETKTLATMPKYINPATDFGFKRIRPVCAVMTIPNTVLLISSQETPVETEQIPFDPSEITEEAW